MINHPPDFYFKQSIRTKVFLFSTDSEVSEIRGVLQWRIPSKISGRPP
ncbi:Uncharacterized protein dnm_054850 [Desulfonema magnum]|uniref:Uncharacterized protein n=1 Tax=Desulfonema magnum TaxID=45655 RepID=A0A975BQ58_9BACT|nr:Uncharacterized protein dnm_054850 [Desulfonema magnum]